MDQTSHDLRLKAFKIILVGTQAVGKSSILCQLISSKFPTAYQATVGIDYHTHTAVVDGKTYSLQIWDTAGQQKFRALTSAYFKNCSACICVYDLSDKESVEKTDYYLGKAVEEKIPEACTFLVGNKSDLIDESKLDSCEALTIAQDKAEKHCIKHRVVSAKEGKGITELFEDLGKSIASQYEESPVETNLQLLSKIGAIKRQDCRC